MWLFVSMLNLILAYLADNNISRCKLCLFFIAAVNIIIFGCRDIGVGTDTLSYINHYFEYANSMTSFNDFFLGHSFDKAFLFLAWVGSIFSNDARILMFLTEALIISFIVLGMYEFKKSYSYSMSLFMLCFVALYQFETINLMRQFCAMSLLFYGYSVFLQKKYSIYFFCQVAAFFFHSTSILFILVPIGQIISYRKGHLKYFVLLVFCTIGLSFTLFYYSFIGFIEQFGLIKESYFESYGRNSVYTGAGNVSVISVLSFLVLLSICCVISKHKQLSSDFIYMFFFLISYNFICQLSSLVISYYIRIAYYFGLIVILYLAHIIKLSKKLEIRLLNYAYILLILFYVLKHFYINYDQNNSYHLIYKSQILGIE